jgi:hypothetical protein
MIKFDLGGLPDSCGSPLYPAPTGGSLRQAQDRLRLPAGKHTSILTDFQTKVNKKMTKNGLFLVIPVK